VLHSKGIKIKGVVPHGQTTETVDGNRVTRNKVDLGAEERLRVYVGPSVPFDKCHVQGPAFAYDPRMDGVKERVPDYKSGVSRYLSFFPLVQDMKDIRKQRKAILSGATETKSE
jgi:hypothetical protein